MSTFATPISTFAGLELIAPFAIPNDPLLRFPQDQICWIGLPAGMTVFAFATGCFARTTGSANGIPGQPALAWTAFQLTPLPQMDRSAFKNITAGLPVQILLLPGAVTTSMMADDVLDSGATLISTPGGSGSTAFLGFAFQDRLCRDPLSAAEAIAASNACDSNWATFSSALASLTDMRNLRVLDHCGAPLSNVAISVSIGGQTSNATSDTNGNTNIVIPAGAQASIATPSIPNAIIGGGDADIGAFDASIGSVAASLTLPPGRRLVQILDAPAWIAQPDSGVSLPRWHANSHIEPIQDGTPYFTRLVTDMRSAKGGGAVQIAGWAVAKGSQADSSIDWPLIPGDASTTIMNLVGELRANNAEIRMLLNKFLQLDSTSIDDFPELLPILWALFAAAAPLQAFAHLDTDPAGYVVGAVGVAALTAVLESSVTLDLLTKAAEYSKPLKDALDEIDPTIAIWTPYPAAFKDNPLVAPGPFKLLGHTLDDISHIGVYHQKHVSIRAATGGRVAYLGGIDINNDRPDTPLHRARNPFHDLQVRVTGPAVQSIVLTYQERATVHGAPHPIKADPVDPVDPTKESPHLVQIARTYYEPATKPGPFDAFAPNGESTPIRTIKSAIDQAKDFIYIEDQYFTPPDDYVDSLVAAGDRGVRALMITVPFHTDQPYGWARRAQVLKRLSDHWGDRLLVGAPLRRFMHEVPGATTNLGRMTLTTELLQSAALASFGPPGRMPAPPFWAFVGNELVLVNALNGAATSTAQPVEIVRSGPKDWGAQPVEHPAGTPVLAVQLPPIYVHAKMMIVDDIFLFAGSSNVNRRGFFHDGELDSFTIPQHLIGDPTNPARTLRARLMAEHLGLSTEMGQALFSDPHSAFHYFKDRSWYEQSRWRPLDFFGSLEPNVPIGTAGSAVMFALKILLGTLQDAAKPDVWPLLADPTSALDPNPNHNGPDLPS